MKVLVIGSGGREHALCWKLAQSPLVTTLYCIPGNPGIARIAQCLSGDPIEAAQRHEINFVVVGPDAYLAEGIIDKLGAVGIPAFGPTQDAARLESSKIFCKELLKKYGIPTGGFASFETADEAKAYLSDLDADVPIVVKADGLAVGKGVVVAANRDEALAAVDEVLGIAQSTVRDASSRILVEEFLQGPEVSLLALTDGETIMPLVPAQDYKRVGEGDTGANTGGMGCYSPVPVLTEEVYQAAIETILKPTIAALRAEGIEYRGVLYAGLMLTENGLRVIEFNARFGDPETQVILPRLQSDLLPLLLACAGQRPDGKTLKELSCEWTDQAAVCVVMSAEGYPAPDYRRGDVIVGLDEAEADGVLVFQAGTTEHNGVTLTGGGRVLGVTALGDDFLQARERCYHSLERIRFTGAHYRRDIGWRCL